MSELRLKSNLRSELEPRLQPRVDLKKRYFKINPHLLEAALIGLMAKGGDYEGFISCVDMSNEQIQSSVRLAIKEILVAMLTEDKEGPFQKSIKQICQFTSEFEIEDKELEIFAIEVIRGVIVKTVTIEKRILERASKIAAIFIKQIPIYQDAIAQMKLSRGKEITTASLLIKGKRIGGVILDGPEQELYDYTKEFWQK